jgi:hypothetical protein
MTTIKAVSLYTSVALALALMTFATASMLTGADPASAATWGQLSWMSARAYNQDGDSALDFCVQTAYHGGAYPNHVDVNVDGDYDGSPCYVESPSYVHSRIIGKRGAYDWLARLEISSSVNNNACDMTEVRAYGYYDSTYRGRERYIHSYDSTAPRTFYITGNPGGLKHAIRIGNETWDYGCDFTGYHVHQGGVSNCNVLNPIYGSPTWFTDVVPPLPNEWDEYYRINQFSFTEYNPPC